MSAEKYGKDIKFLGNFSFNNSRWLELSINEHYGVDGFKRMIEKVVIPCKFRNIKARQNSAHLMKLMNY